MKKQLLLFVLISGAVLFNTTSYSQNWVYVGSGLPSHYANANKEILEFNGSMYTVGYVYDGISTYTPSVHNLNGGTWAQVGSGFTTTASAGLYSINAIAEFNAELYIGGNFIMDNGTDPAFNDVAKWDNVNSRWVPVGDGTGDGVVNELTVFNNKLYAGGDFGDLGAAGTNNLAVWNGASWAAVGTGVSVATDVGFGNDQVTSMVVYNGDLYIGGKFTTAGGELTHNIAIWTAGDVFDFSNFVGNNIEGYGGVGAISDGYILSMVVFGSDLLIGGSFTYFYNGTFIGTPTTTISLVVWDGTFISRPSKVIPVSYPINALNVFNGRVYAGNINSSAIYSWNGNPIWNWELEPDRDPIRQRVSGFYSNATDIYYAQSYGVFKLTDPLPEFYASTTTCAGTNVTFTDISTGTNTITGWNWTFAGGTPATSPDQNPVVTFAAGGPYDVTLAVTSSDGTNTITKTGYITIEDAVSISVDPLPSTICSNQNATFSVSGASGTGGVTYQWQINDGTGYVNVVDIAGEVSGATFSTLTLTSPAVALSGSNVKCVVTNGCGSTVTSAEALLTVTAAPEITQNPVDKAVCEDGGDVSFNVVSTGATTYQWQYYVGPNNYSNLSDAGVYTGTNTATLLITGADNTTILNELYDTDFSDGKTGAYYRCVLTANGCTTNSGLYYLTIYAAPTITSHPTDVTNCDIGSGSSATFSIAAEVATGVAATSFGGMSYQWQINDGTGYVNVVDIAGEVSGATNNVLNLSGVTSAMSGYKYKCLVGNCTVPVESFEATLAIDNQPILISSPVSTTICNGDDVTFTAEVTGSNLIYQWQEAPANSSSYSDIINGGIYFATDGTLNITGATTSLDGKRYRCVVSSGVCDVANNKALTTGNALLRVYGDVTLTPSTSTSQLTVCENGSTTLRVNTGGGYNSLFHQLQWQVDFAGTGVFIDIIDDANYVGTQTRSLTINNAPFSFNGNQYRCVVTNCSSTIVSTPETLTVNQLPLVTTSPQSQSICKGETATFTAQSSIGTDVKYYWMVDQGSGYSQLTSAAVAGTDGFSTLTLTNVQTNSIGYKYKCVAIGATPCDPTIISESLEATLTVNEVTPVSAIQSASICNGENATFTFDVLGDGLTYQWQVNGSDVADDAVYSGANTATLTITGASVTSIGNSNSVTCNVTGNCGTASQSAGLQIYGTEKPVITADFSSPTQPYLYVGNVNGDSFEWRLNGSFYSSGGQIYVAEAGSYTVVVSQNGCASEESDAQVIVITNLDKDVLNNIEAYPNPVTDHLIIRLVQVTENTTISVIGLDGKVKISQLANGLDSTIDMSGLAKGTYLVQVRNSEQALTYKVIKQ